MKNKLVLVIVGLLLSFMAHLNAQNQGMLAILNTDTEMQGKFNENLHDFYTRLRILADNPNLIKINREKIEIYKQLEARLTYLRVMLKEAHKNQKFSEYNVAIACALSALLGGQSASMIEPENFRENFEQYEEEYYKDSHKIVVELEKLLEEDFQIKLL